MKDPSHWAHLILLLLPAVWILPLVTHPTGIAFQPGSAYSDLAITHWPNVMLVRRSLIDSGQIPLWNPQILAGTPFAANPLSGLWYPPLWLAFLLPASLAFNLLFFLHLAWAGLGAFKLSRVEGMEVGPSLIAGIVFGGLPKLVAHIGAGHLTLVLAVSWTPWLLVSIDHALGNWKAARAAAVGLTAGVVFLIDPRWALPALALGLAFGLRQAWRRSTRVERVVGLFGLAALFGAGVIAVLALPLAEFLSLSSRAALTPPESLTLSLPPQFLVGLLLPHPGSSAEWTVYIGMTASVLGVIALISRRSGWFWPVAAILSVLAALGSYTPIYPAVAGRIPGLALLRVPARFFFLAGLSVAVIAARGASMLLGAASDRSRHALRLAGWGGLAAGLAAVVVGLAHSSAGGLTAAGLFLALMGIVLFVQGHWPLHPEAAAVMLAAVAVLELGWFDSSLTVAQPASALLAQGSSVAEFLAGQPGIFRTYSPSYSLPQQTAARHGVQLVDGVDPLQLEATVRLVSRASGIAGSAYSVTLPAFASGDPSRDNMSAVPDPALLGLLNARFVLSAFPLEANGLSPLGQFDSVYLYANKEALPRAWIAASLSSWNEPLVAQAAEVSRYSPNNIRIEAEGPGWLVLSEAYYPGWFATMDGARAEIVSAGGWFRALQLPSGRHRVDMVFSPPRLWQGLGLTLLTLVAFLGAATWRG